jgi:periplasmic protein TonB
MFETVNRRNCTSALRRLLSFLISITGHALALMVFVILPLMYFNILPETEILAFLIGPPPPPAPVPPPRPVRREKAPLISPVRLEMIQPISLPVSIPPPDEESSWSSLLPAMAQNDPGRSGIGLPNRLAPDLLEIQIPETPPPPKPLRTKAIPVVSKVQEAKLLVRIEPAYPDLAIRARISGTVILQVTVDEEGNVADIQVLSGRPMLNEAALEAVRQWKYSPTLLNGEPVSVVATVNVVFTLRR